VGAAWVLRAPRLSGPELGARLGWHRLYLGGDYAAADWSWDGRPIAFVALGAELGARLPFLTGPHLALGGLVAARLERVSLRRRDVAGASSHPYADAGATAGLEGRWQPWRRVHLALFVDGTWRPISRRVDIAGGPSLRLDAWSARLGANAGLDW
jgi:hypothetical protein